MAKKTKSKAFPLNEVQKQILLRRFQTWQELGAAFQVAKWYNRRARYAHAMEAYGITNDLVLSIAGHGAVLSVVNGEPLVTLP